jgi:hypothetical protein
MFVHSLRQAVQASPRSALPEVSSLLWRAYAAGQVGEEDAQALSDTIEARKALPVAPAPARRHVGSRPRTDASMERRRRWAASGSMPPQLQARFTQAEAAVMAVVAAEARVKGSCRLHNAHIAAVGGVSVSTVKNAVRVARKLGFIRVEERRRSAWRNDSNVITVVDLAWLAWLRLRRAGVGLNPCPPRIQEQKKGASERRGAKGAPTPDTGYGGVRATGRWKLCR